MDAAHAAKLVSALAAALTVVLSALVKVRSEEAKRQRVTPNAVIVRGLRPLEARCKKKLFYGIAWMSRDI